jgi:hypothetical protein
MPESESIESVNAENGARGARGGLRAHLLAELIEDAERYATASQAQNTT